MLYCSSECGSISIMQLRTIYCNTHVHTFHVCLCLLALTFVCNSTYLLKCSFQIYQKSILVFIRSSKVWFKTTSCAKGPVTRCNFLGNLQRNCALKRCKLFLFKSAVLVRLDLSAPVYQVFHYTSIYILRQLTLPCFRTFSNLTQGDRIPI